MIAVYHVTYEEPGRNFRGDILQLWSLLGGALAGTVEQVALVEAGDLERAYALTQNVEVPWRAYAGLTYTGAAPHARSTSVGDVLVEMGEDGVTPGAGYLIQPVGFRRLPPFVTARVMSGPGTSGTGA